MEMKFSGREEVLAALREMEEMKEGRWAETGEYYAHIDFQVVVTYMGRLPVEFSAEGYVSTDRVEDLQPGVRKAFKQIADTENVFNTLERECSRDREGETHGTEYDEEAGPEEEGSGEHP